MMPDRAGRMVRLQSGGSETELSGNHSDGPDETAVFPPTYIVIKFSKNIHGKALYWIIEKIMGKRRDGGAELLVRRQPSNGNKGITLHVSASKIKFLEVAEELELKKRDREGILREFTVSQLEDFLDEGMHMDDLLTTAERQRIVRHELENIRALMEDDHVPGHPGLSLYEGQSILQACLHWKLVEQLYPLHEKEVLKKLGKKWYGTLFRKQPFEEIRLYFGEAVSLYFIFLGFYTTALVIPMILGFIQLLVSAESITFFCLFNVLWVTVFLEIWKRKSNELAFSWGTINMTSLDDDPRPNFRGHMAVDRVTGRIQPQFPRWKTYARMYCISLPIVIICMMGAFVIMLVSFWAEEQLMVMKREEDFRWSTVIVMMPSVVYTGLVYIMNLYYRQLATYLTEWENHRTQSQYDRHRVTKLVLFEFVNNFMSLFYIAFYIQDMDMLRSQLAVMLIILQAINNFQEALLPLLLKYYGNKMSKIFNSEKLFGYESGDFSLNMKPKAKRKLSDTDPALLHLMEIVPELDICDPRIKQADKEGEMDYFEGTYDDYLELFVQLGYVLLFSSVYPIAAFWAVVNNIIEIRADAFKLCRVFQRPMTKRVKDTGAWQRAFEAIGAMSVMTNCGLMCINPQLRQQRPDVGAVEWVLFFVFLEHLLLVIRHILHKVIPDKPEWVRIALAKNNYQSKQALKNERMLKNRRQILQRKYRTIHGPHKRSQ
ncbi:anoctamin-10 isoform X2 [Anabrus simplex]|uniref:anoctamin-10 isoform X2 n=1 Tax=Anabrus simplex TaxID=316456 RepID=UPI0034DCEBC5